MPAEPEAQAATTVRLPAALLKRAKLYAIEAGTTLQQLIIEGLEARLANKRQARKSTTPT